MHMQGKDEVSIAITFIIGFIGGFYFFLTGYAPYAEEVKENIFTQDQDTIESLIIVGEQYGGCERMGRCASFQLEYDGTYSYLPYSILQGARPVTGILPSALLADIRSATLLSKLRSASLPASADNCISYVDGVDYSYEIVRNGELFELDTCTTNLNKHPEILRAFEKIWDYVESN